jgi:hypothetical protein
MRRAAFLTVLVSWVSLSLMSCSKHLQTIPPTKPPSAAQIPTGETGPFIVIGHLEHRDRVVTIKSGAQGVVYSVRNRDGKILFDNLTAAQLKAQSPEIHDFIEAGTASHAGMAEPQIPMKVMQR